MKINELAKLTGLTVRTLHYYDEIGLLNPGSVTEAGYRIYDDSALADLQQILFFRELEFSLSEIKEMMNNADYNKTEVLEKQRELLQIKRNRLDRLIELLDHTIKGENTMNPEEFDMTEIEKVKKEYAAEVKERWGKTSAYAESEKRTSQYDRNKWNMLHGEETAILKQFSKCRTQDPTDDNVQELVQTWQNHITKNFYECTIEILSCLGQMYVNDPRFMENIDVHGEGTAQFMADAIEVYCHAKTA